MDLIARVLGKLRGASFLKGEGGTVVCAARRGLGGSSADVATCWRGSPALTAQDRPRLPLDFEARSKRGPGSGSTPAGTALRDPRSLPLY